MFHYQNTTENKMNEINEIIKYQVFLNEISSFKEKIFKYFQIDVSEKPEILCMQTSLLTLKPTIDILVLIDILDEKHNNSLDDKNLSLDKLITKHYGQDAFLWFANNLTKPEYYKPH